jgi:hypothetical protein
MHAVSAEASKYLRPPEFYGAFSRRRKGVNREGAVADFTFFFAGCSGGVAVVNYPVVLPVCNRTVSGT